MSGPAILVHPASLREGLKGNRLESGIVVRCNIQVEPFAKFILERSEGLEDRSLWIPPSGASRRSRSIGDVQGIGDNPSISIA